MTFAVLACFVSLQLDGQMAYKMALAWHVTGDDRYAAQVLEIADAWASTTQDWGVES